MGCFSEQAMERQRLGEIERGEEREGRRGRGRKTENARKNESLVRGKEAEQERRKRIF